MSCMLAPILARGCFSPISGPWCKCVEMGFKNPSNVFYSKAAVMSAKRNTQKKSISGLKSSERAFCFQRRGSIDGADRRSSGKLESWSCTRFSAWAHLLWPKSRNDRGRPIQSGHMAPDTSPIVTLKSLMSLSD
jgi:hypothetical protein